MFDTQNHIKVRRVIFQSLIATGFLTKNKDTKYFALDEYIVDYCNTSTISWDANGHYYELGYYELFAGTAERCLINVRPIDDNIDQVALVVSTAMFYKYCAVLDYHKNEIGFSLSTYKYHKKT